MADQTINYNLEKPAGNEYYDIEVFNANMDKIDTQMKANANAADAKIPKSLADGADKVLMSSGAGSWVVKTLVDIKTWLGLGSAAYTSSGNYATSAQGATADNAMPKSLATGADQVPVSTGSGAWTVKTLNQFKSWLGLGSAAYTASTDYAVASKGVTNGDSHDHNGGDGAQIDHVNLANKGSNTHAQIDTHIAASAPHSGHETPSGAQAKADVVQGNLTTHLAETTQAHGGIVSQTNFAQTQSEIMLFVYMGMEG